MLKPCLLLSIFLLLNSPDCDPQKQDQRISSLESEVKQLKDKVAELEQKQAATPEHRYELRSEGFRTFRFDPSTCETCIQLTSDADWKRKETKAQSCDCADTSRLNLALPRSTDQQRQEANDDYNIFVKPACGT
jgi:hypothetical protein